jgi:hypothetical protein
VARLSLSSPDQILPPSVNYSTDQKEKGENKKDNYQFDAKVFARKNVCLFQTQAFCAQKNFSLETNCQFPWHK